MTEDQHEPLWREIGGMTRAIGKVERNVAELDEIVKSDGIQEIKSLSRDLRILIYGDEKVGAKGLVHRLNDTEISIRELTRQRDQLKWILIGVGLASVTQTGLLISIAKQVFGGIP